METASKKLAEARTKLEEIGAADRPGLGDSVYDFLDRQIRQLIRNPNLFDTYHSAFLAAIEKAPGASRNAVDAARQRLIQNGLATNLNGGRLEWHPIRHGTTKIEKRLTPFERQLIERFNASLLSSLNLQAALSVTSSPNYVDDRLFTSKSWRDVYHYDAQGKLTGWTRHAAAGATDFTEDGLIVLDKDAANRPIKVQTVRYVAIPAQASEQPSKLEVSLGEEIINYAYENGERVVKSRARAKLKK